MLVKPTTFMNLSGVAVRKVLARQRAPLDDMLVVVDDFDLPLGRVRLRERGSAGTHNGLRSIIGELGSQDFARLRVGIGQPSRDAKDHVLSRFTAKEKKELDAVLDAAAEAVEDWAHEGPSRAANKWNSWSALTEGGGADDSDGEDKSVDAGGRALAGGRAPGTDDQPTIVRRATGWRRLLPRAERER
jgi:PTH1 family peptidyl-tRNA hydrolase